MVEGLRQRRRMAADEEPGVTQPLLDEHEDERGSHGELRPPLPSHQQRQVIVYQPFNLQSFLYSIFLCWRQVIDAVYLCMSQVLPLPAPLPALTPLQEHELQRLRDRAAQKFDAESADDQEALRKLWTYAFPDLPCPTTSLKSPHWKDMGWQGEDPATDIRGSGRLGLDCLLYLADTYPTAFSNLMHKVNGSRAEWEYPFAVAGLNLSFKLMEVIGVSPSGPRTAAASASFDVSRVLASPAGRGFVSLMAREGEDSERVFEELFVAAFEELDREWLAQRASYMQFNQVLGAVTARVQALLAARPRSLGDLRTRLLGAS